MVAWAAVDDDKALVATNQGVAPRGLSLPGAPSKRTARLARDPQGGLVGPRAADHARPRWPRNAPDTRCWWTARCGFLLLEPGEVPDQVRTRVTRSVAYTSHHPMTVGGVRVVGRRVAGRNGLSWAVRYDSGTPVELSAVTELTDELVAAAQAATAPTD